MFTLIAGFVLSSTLGIQQPRATPPPDPRERLDTAIAEGIKLLEAKDYVKFLTMFVPPDALAGQNIEQFAADFARRKGPMALAALKEIQTAKPTMSNDGLTATYAVTPGPDGGPTSMMWSKIGKYWYIAK
jgi:hypothetical protein